MSSRKILFISHDAGRTGAPFILLNFQRWLKAHSDVEFTTILRRTGPLAGEFAELGNTVVIDPRSKPRTVFGRVSQRLGWTGGATDDLLAALQGHSYPLIYSNTVTNGDLLGGLVGPGVQVITHIHELNYWIERSGRENWEQVRRHTTKFIAVSEAVSANLQQRHEIPPERVEVVHEFIPVNGSTHAETPEQGKAIRAQLKIPTDAFVVGGSGTETWRKGKDLFVQLAALLRRRQTSRPFCFVWVGWPGDEEDQRQLKHDIEKAGIADWFRWTGEVANPLQYFSCFDAFTLVSREDPFPLVCLETALLQKPILCFAGAGGAPELLEEDCGFVVPYLDLAAMADKLQLLAQDKDLGRRMGACGAAKVRARFSLDVAAPRLLSIIDQLLGNAPKLNLVNANERTS